MVDIAEDFDCDRYKENPEKFGDHMFDVRNAAQQNTSVTPTKQRMSMKQFSMA